MFNNKWGLLKTHLLAISALLFHVLTEHDRLTVLSHRSVRITGAYIDNMSEVRANCLPLDINITFETGFKPSKDLIILVDADRKVGVLEHKKDQNLRWTTKPHM